MREIKEGMRVRHFKGNYYDIKGIAEHTETGEKFVVYRADYGEHKLYIRPLNMFLEEVDRVKYPNVAQKYRFEIVE